ncbi:MAG: hypothetical protein WC658_01375, partial [Candidatus Omnitrophota bacterium]
GSDVFSSVVHYPEMVGSEDAGVDLVEELEKLQPMICDLARVVKTMKDDRPHSSLLWWDAPVQGRKTCADILAIKMWMSLTQPYGLYVSPAVTEQEVLDYEEEMQEERDLSIRLFHALKRKDYTAAQKAYAQIQRIASRRFSQAMEEEQLATEARKWWRGGGFYNWQERHYFSRTCWGRVSRGLPLEDLDAGTWAVSGAMYFLNGKPQEEIERALADFQEAIAGYQAWLGRRRGNNTEEESQEQGLSEEKAEQALAIFVKPEYIEPITEKRETVSVSSSLKTRDEGAGAAAGRALERYLLARRAQEKRQRVSGFNAALADGLYVSFEDCVTRAYKALGEAGADITTEAFGKFLGYARRGMIALIDAYAPTGERREMLQRLERVFDKGREFNADAWVIFMGKGEELGDIGLMALAVTPDKDKLRRIARAAGELMDTAFALSHTIEYAQLSNADIAPVGVETVSSNIFKAVATFFSNTVYDHTFDYTPKYLHPVSSRTAFSDYNYIKGRWLGDGQPFTRKEILEMACADHRWLNIYFYNLFSSRTWLKNESAEFAQALLGDYEQGEGVVGIGVGGRHTFSPEELEWWTYIQNREFANLEQQKHRVAGVFIDLDADKYLAAKKRPAVGIISGLGRPHLTCFFEELPNYNAENPAHQALWVLGRAYDFEETSAGERLMNIPNGLLYVSREEYIAMRAAQLFEAGIVASRPKAKAIACEEAERHMQRNPKGILIAATFKQPLVNCVSFTFHGAPYYLNGDDEAIGLPSAQSWIANLQFYDKTVQHRIYYEGCGVEVPEELQWYDRFHEGRTEEQIRREILKGSRRFKGLRYMHVLRMIAKAAEQSGGRGSLAENGRDAKGNTNERNLDTLAEHIFEVGRSGDNIVIQECIHSSPRAWASKEYMDILRDALVTKGISVPQSAALFVYSRIIAIYINGELDYTLELVVASRQTISNVGMGGVLRKWRIEYAATESVNDIFQEARRATVKRSMELIEEQAYSFWDEIMAEEDNPMRGRLAVSEASGRRDRTGWPYAKPRYIMHDLLDIPIIKRPDGELIYPEIVDYKYGADGLLERIILIDKTPGIGNWQRLEVGPEAIVGWLAVKIEDNIGYGLWQPYKEDEENSEKAAARKEGRPVNPFNYGGDLRKIMLSFSQAAHAYRRQLPRGRIIFGDYPAGNAPCAPIAGSAVRAKKEQAAEQVDPIMAMMDLSRAEEVTPEELRQRLEGRKLYACIWEDRGQLTDLPTLSAQADDDTEVVGVNIFDVAYSGEHRGKVAALIYFDAATNKYKTVRINEPYIMPDKVHVLALAMALPNGRQTTFFCPVGSQTTAFWPVALARDEVTNHRWVSGLYRELGVVQVNANILSAEGQTLTAAAVADSKFETTRMLMVAEVPVALAIGSQTTAFWPVPLAILLKRATPQEQLSAAIAGLMQDIRASGRRGAVYLRLQPNQESEGRGQQLFKMPNQRVRLIQALREELQSRDMIVRIEVGNARYGEERRRVTLRINVRDDSDEVTGFAQIGAPESIVSSKTPGGLIMPIDQAIEDLFFSLDPMQQDMQWQDVGLTEEELQAAISVAHQALAALNAPFAPEDRLHFAGIDLELEFNTDGALQVAYVLDINPRATGLRHAEKFVTDVSETRPSFLRVETRADEIGLEEWWGGISLGNDGSILNKDALTEGISAEIVKANRERETPITQPFERARMFVEVQERALQELFRQFPAEFDRHMIRRVIYLGLKATQAELGLTHNRNSISYRWAAATRAPPTDQYWRNALFITALEEARHLLSLRMPQETRPTTEEDHRFIDAYLSANPRLSDAIEYTLLNTHAYGIISHRGLRPLSEVKVAIDDLSRTLVDFASGEDGRMQAVTPQGLVDYYNEWLGAGGIQVVNTGDNFEDALHWWIARLDPAVWGRIIVLSLSGMVCHRLNPETRKWEVVYSLLDLLTEEQREHWEAFRRMWLEIMMEAGEIFFGGFQRKSDYRDTYRYAYGHIDDRGFQITTHVASEYIAIAAEEVEMINEHIAWQNQIFAAYGLPEAALVVAGEERCAVLRRYLAVAYQLPEFCDFGFEPQLIKIHDYAVDSTPIAWDKGRGLIKLREDRILEDMFGVEIDWSSEVEMRGDGFAQSNDRYMAEALPQTPGISVGDEEQAECPPNITAYKGFTPETRKGSRALLESIETRGGAGRPSFIRVSSTPLEEGLGTFSATVHLDAAGAIINQDELIHGLTYILYKQKGMAWPNARKLAAAFVFDLQQGLISLRDRAGKDFQAYLADSQFTLQLTENQETLGLAYQDARTLSFHWAALTRAPPDDEDWKNTVFITCLEESRHLLSLRMPQETRPTLQDDHRFILNFIDNALGLSTRLVSLLSGVPIAGEGIYVQRAAFNKAAQQAIQPEIEDYLFRLLTDAELSRHFVTHFAVDYLLRQLPSPLSAEFESAAAAVMPRAARRIIEDDLHVSVESLFDLIQDPVSKTQALTNLISQLEDYTNEIPAADDWVFDKSSRAMRFISACLDELSEMGASVPLQPGREFLSSALQRFGQDDAVLRRLIEEVNTIKAAAPVDLRALAKSYEKIVPRLINLKVIHFYEAKYGRAQASAIPQENLGVCIKVTFPVGISYSRCAWDNMGRIPRAPGEVVRYLLAGIRFSMGGEAVPAGCVTVRTLGGPKLILYAKSYDESGGEPAILEFDLHEVSPAEFSDYSDTRFRLMKEVLVASGIVTRDSEAAGQDILYFTRGQGLEIVVDTVVPGGTGLGTSGIVTTALLIALDRLQGKDTQIDPNLGDCSVYTEHRLGLSSGMQDWRRPIAGPNPFKVYHQPGTAGFPSAEAEFLNSVDAEEARRHLVLFFPGFKRQATGRLNTVLSGHLARDRDAYQAMLDVIRLQDELEEALARNDFEAVGRLSEGYRQYREIMDPTTEEHILQAIDAIISAPDIWGAAFTGSPGGVMMIWCPAEAKGRVIAYLEGLRD